MLTFVGLGLYDERSVTIRGREAIRGADRVFAEWYTSHLAGATPALARGCRPTCRTDVATDPGRPAPAVATFHSEGVPPSTALRAVCPRRRRRHAVVGQYPTA